MIVCVVIVTIVTALFSSESGTVVNSARRLSVKINIFFSFLSRIV